MAEDEPLIPSSSLLEALPVELVLQIIENLENDADLAHLASCSKALKEIVRSDDVWRMRCIALWQQHGSADLSKANSNPLFDSSVTGYYQLWSRFFGLNKRFLGFFASSLPYNGRLIRFSLHLTSSAELEDESNIQDRFKILARELSISNVIADRGNFVDQYIPSTRPSPFAAYSLDLYEPRYHWSTILAITAKEGACIPLQNNASYIPLDLSYLPRHQAEIEEDFSVGSRLQDIFAHGNDSWSWPTTSLIHVNALLGPLTWLNSSLLELPAVSWAPKSVDVNPDQEVVVPQSPVPVFERPGPRFIYQRPQAQVMRQPQPPVNIQIVRRDNQTPMVYQFNGNARAGRAWEEGIRQVLRGRAAGSQKSEVYLPLRVSQDDRSVARGEDIFPSHLTGLWSGTYGAHGIEIGYINCRPVHTAIHHADEVDIEEIDVPAADPRLIRRGSTSGVRHIIEYCKVTGDINVPCGQVSWNAVLGRSNSSSPGPLPSVSEEKLATWIDAPVASYEASRSGWEDGRLEGKGRLAFQGYVEPRQSDAQVYFVRSRREDGRESINEIRLMWLELGKVSIFRRIMF